MPKNNNIIRVYYNRLSYAYSIEYYYEKDDSNDYDQDEREGVLLYNDEFFYGGFLDKGVPKESDIFSISDLSAEVQTMLKNKNLKEFYGYNESLRWCIGEKYVFDGGRDASGNKYGVLAHTTYLPDKYDLNGNCKGENPAYFYWTY